jgi:hypothetical protein
MEGHRSRKTQIWAHVFEGVDVLQYKCITILRDNLFYEGGKIWGLVIKVARTFAIKWG